MYEHLVVEEENISTFTQKLDDAADEGFKVISSNSFYMRHDVNGRAIYETTYYALLVRSSDDNDEEDDY
ncbi:hypothetical protein C8P68_1032 [Mucilaginibacter yixingensis]|uniref:Uncharacterized protein n=2 Tax=Mucilaginibacter yixingensis TaxID=1295612 RepID=A0A2T5JAG0_9SPHI|nr:hypothetical protein C8P68_1032 [Mucilaginibacter yixingensis]